jgi:hypothetical protein
VAKTIAKITGTALRPGISKNGRLYTKAHITSAVARAQARIAEGTRPMTMLTHHLAGDDSTQIVGRVDKWSVGPEGEARYESSVADTPHGRTIAALADQTDGQPFLKNVSIRGGWLGSVRTVRVDGQPVETGEDLELDGLDFTKSPGVTGADIDSLSYTDSSLPTESAGRTLIYETVPEAHMQITEEAPTAPSVYADPGYRTDRQQRYPLDTLAQARTTWAVLGTPELGESYTKAQHVRMRDRVRRALERHGATVDATQGWVITPATAVESVTEYGGDYPDARGSFSVSISNGTVDISVSSWRIDPTDLEVCARAAMEGACRALAAMDPDADGDIDIPGVESAPADAVTEHDTPEPTTGPGETTEQEIGTVADQPTTGAADAPQTTTPPAGTPAAEAPAAPAAAPAPAIAPGVTLTDDQFSQLLAKLGQPVAAPPAAPVVEQPAGELVGAGAPAESAPAAPAGTPAPVAETEADRFARAVAEAVKAALPLAIQEAAQQPGGTPARKGLVAPVGETAATTTAAGDTQYPEGWPTDETGEPVAPHKLPRDQADRLMRPSLTAAVLRGRMAPGQG